MEIFSQNPRSFKMDRKSTQASNLKSSISEKLFEFLGSYSDDVLAEYIVVLVCNGKHQYQARVDLEAFLGDESGKFVAWLWGHISKTASMSKTPSAATNVKQANITNACDDNLDEEQKLARYRISDKPLSKDKKPYMLSTFSPQLISLSKINDISEDYQRWCPGVAASTNVISEEVHAHTIRSEIPGKQTGTCKEAMKYRSSRERCFDGISAGSEQFMHLEDQSKKTVSNNNSGPPHLLWHSPKKESVLRDMHTVATDNPHLKPLFVTNAAATEISSRAADAASHHDTRRRGNVWDRLGKPRKDNNARIGDGMYSHDVDIIKRKKLDHSREGLEKHRLMLVVPDGRLERNIVGEVALLDSSSGKLFSGTHTNESARLEHSVNAMNRLNDASNGRRKRQLGEIDTSDSLVCLSDGGDRRLQEKGPLQGLQRSQSINHDRTQGLNGVTSGTGTGTRSSDEKFSGATSHSLKSPNTAMNPGACKRSQPQLKIETSVDAAQAPVLVSSSLPAKSESLSQAGSQQTNHKPVQAEVLDMKLKLQQIETEMIKLRSKQAEMNIDGKLNAPLGSCAQNHSEEDSESRTVFVTNVHFAATKEALSSHFSKCGAVMKTTLLTDPVTAQPKGSAYVVFGSKAAADKAVAISGTSFLSRTLKVVRKADVFAGISVPAQLTGKPSQLCRQTPPIKKGSVQRPFFSSHLQWRRDPPGNAESSSILPSRPEVSKNPGEHGSVEAGC